MFLEKNVSSNMVCPSSIRTVPEIVALGISQRIWKSFSDILNCYALDIWGTPWGISWDTHVPWQNGCMLLSYISDLTF